MNAVYIIVENGEPYPLAYVTYESAALAVQTRHKEEIDRQIAEVGNEDICSDVNVPENISTGITHLYVEKGLNIYIYKLPTVLSQS
jgi:hypothetical protein